jgi:hypothetical protein
VLKSAAVAYAVWSIRNSPCTVAPRPLAGERRSPWSRRGASVDSWSETKSLMVIMVVIAIFYVLGRVVADALGVSL